MGVAFHHAPSLTPAERAVVGLLLQGHGIAGAAAELVVSRHTVRVHVRNAHAKTRTHRLDELVAWAHRHEGCCLTVPGNLP